VVESHRAYNMDRVGDRPSIRNLRPESLEVREITT
jgi:hypothetical protein